MQRRFLIRNALQLLRSSQCHSKSMVARTIAVSANNKNTAFVPLNGNHHHHHHVLKRKFSSDPKEAAAAAQQPQEQTNLEEELPNEEKLQDLTPEMLEQVCGPSHTHEFQAETKQLLDIVARSLYTDTEVFVRELISNASDALEKARYQKLVAGGQAGDDLRIRIFTDPNTATLIIQDNGIGMHSEEMVKNLGTIAHSGSKAFVQTLLEQGKEKMENVIGHFGVGFYSSFMVADKVTVYSSPMDIEEPIGYRWSSKGDGHFEIAQAEGVSKGTKIVLNLKEGFKHFADPAKLRNIISTYSNFVAFPIELNGKVVNTIQAIWRKQPSAVSEAEHTEFYRYISGGFDEPMLHLHYNTDAPLAIRALFYVPTFNPESFSFGQKQDMDVSLYCRRVLIKAKARNILPEWLRFLKGVVDCEDIPLNISREHMQDSAMIRKLHDVLTKRIVKWFLDEANKDPAKYDKFYEQFHLFVMEGACTPSQSAEVGKLLRMNSTHSETEKCFLADYVSRMKPKQEKIYYVTSATAADAKHSPYLEGYLKEGIEVLTVDQTMEIVLSNVRSFQGKSFASVEHENPPALDETKKEDDAASTEGKLTDDEIKELTTWMKDVVLTTKVAAVKTTNRLSSTPAVILGHENQLHRKLFKLRGMDLPDHPSELHINPSHPIIKDLFKSKNDNPETAKTATELLLINAQLTAGLIADPHVVTSKVNEALACLLKPKN